MHRDSGQFGFSQRARRAGSAPINDLIQKALATPGLISLAAGLVDEETLPCQATAELAHEVLRGAAGRAALQYGSTAGLEELRARVLEYLQELDGACGRSWKGRVEDLVITTGSQQLLYILGELLIDPGDIVLVGWPDYFVYTGALASFGAQFRAVEMDEEGGGA